MPSKTVGTPPPSPFQYSWPRLAPTLKNIACILGLALVGNDAVKHANHFVTPDNQVTVFSFLAVTMMVIELDNLCGVENLSSEKGE